MTNSGNPKSSRWWALGRGDLDVMTLHLGLQFAQLLIPVFLLIPPGIPLEFSVSHLLPGFALGFLIGSAGLIGLAVRMRKDEARYDVTAPVFGSNVTAIITYTLGIILPVYVQTHDELRAWQIGAAAVIWTGVLKLLAAPFAGIIRRTIPVPASMTVFGAAMYSYLAFVLLQRIFDNALVGIVALSIVAVCGLANVPITRWRIPPFVVAWVIPLAVGLSIGYVHPAWHPMAFQLPLVMSVGPIHAMVDSLPYLSVIVPMTIYQILQDIASVEGAAAAGDDFSTRSVLAWDGIGTLLCGVAGSVITPVVYAMHPPYKRMGARIGFAVWTPIILIIAIMSNVTIVITQFFPWPILSAMIAYVSVGVGLTTLHRVDRKYWSAVLLGFVIPIGTVVAAAINSALPALNLSVANTSIQAALDKSVYWSSVQGLGNGFLFLVLVISALITETINRAFGRAAIWCVAAAVFSWLGLMHSTVFRWKAEPVYAVGWLAAAAIVLSAKWWRGDAVTPE